MKVAQRWLERYIDCKQPASEISAALTAVGLEVEALEEVEKIKGGLQGLVIGEVKECIAHPNADKLRLTKVDIGAAELLQIVCGAPNVATGQKVVVATVGTTVHPTTGEPFKINKSKIRSELSEGMLCADDEIGLGHSHEGIRVLPADAPIGMPVREYLKIESEITYEIGLTPNRADAASHYGVARDLSAYFNVPLKALPLDYSDSKDAKTVQVSIADTEACLRFVGVLVENVQITESPEWLQTALQSIGLKSINNIVDLTNFVCHGLGQPMHAYDAAKIKGGIQVRHAVANEGLVTLDGIKRTLLGHEIVIADDSGPIGLAGIMGGQATAVNAETISVYFESAYFNSVLVRKAAKSHALKTDASFRFERGTDPTMCLTAMQYALSMLQSMQANCNIHVVNDIYPVKIEALQIDFNFDYCRSLIGFELADKEIEKILNGLGIETIASISGGITVGVPPSKVDVTRPCDLVEEVLRMYGLNNIPMPKQLRSSLSFAKRPDLEKVKETISEMLSARGFSEMMSNSLSAERFNTQLGNVSESVVLVNPLSNDLNVLRNQMLGSGLEAIAYNLNRKVEQIQLFEWGKTYHKAEERYTENEHLALFVSGKKHAAHWSHKAASQDVYSLKNSVEAVLQRVGINNFKTQALSSELGAGFQYLQGKTVLLQILQVGNAVLKSFDIQQAVFYADFNWQTLEQIIQKSTKTYREAPKYPEVRRDLSMLLDKAVQFEQLQKIARQAEQGLLKNVDIFDVYEGEKLPAGKKSYALSFVLQDEERTLQEQQIDQVMNKLIRAFEKELGAEIRKA